MTQKNTNRLNLSAGLFSVAVAITLVLTKLWALYQTQSLSIAATLADSALDLLMSMGGLAAIAYAAKPADDDHAFGHTSAEDLAALGQALFILVSAIAIAGTAVLRLMGQSTNPIEAEGAGFAVMLLSIVLTLMLVGWQRYVSQKTGNRVVVADSLHYVGDLIPAIGAIIALWAHQMFGIDWIDNMVAILAAAIMARGAAHIGLAAWHALMDRAADDVTIASIEGIAGSFDGVYGFHDLKTRRAGSRVFVNLHIELDGDQTLDAAHSIGAALRRAIVAAHPEADVLIHLDPVGVQPHPDDTRYH